MVGRFQYMVIRYIHACPRQLVSLVSLMMWFIAGVLSVLDVMQELRLSGDVHV